jgi:hypothetical protein
MHSAFGIPHPVYPYGISTFIRLTSAGWTSVPFRRGRMRLDAFPVSRWLLDERYRRSLPVPVVLNRLAAPRFDFIFGMASSLFGPPA